MKMRSTTVSSHSQFQPLKEVWVGGTYPAQFYTHLGNKAHDIFARITEITEKDFNRLEKIINDLGVTTVRPKFTKVDDYLDEHDHLLKPPISPCDFALTLANTLYIIPQYPSSVDPYQHAIDQYRTDNQHVHILDRSIPDPWAWITFASVVRAGRDILIDYDPNISESILYAKEVAKTLGKNYRVHLSATGDHNDGVFCPIQRGHIMTSHYRQVYKESFPGWSVFHLPNTTLSRVKEFGTHQKWWLPNIDFGHFNSSIISVAESWLGSPHETVFEVNMLVIDEKNIICGAYNELAFKYFESLGITPHLVEFESRLFWDAGIHCLTSDIHRTGQCEDYWPDRGPNGIYNIKEWTS